MKSCGNYHFQIRKVAEVADGSLDSLLIERSWNINGPADQPANVLYAVRGYIWSSLVTRQLTMHAASDRLV